MRNPLIVTIAITLILCVQHDKIEANVVRVIDGDAIVVKIDGKLEKVRLLGIDCPKAQRNKPFEYNAIINLTYLAKIGQFIERQLESKIVEL